MKKNIVLVGGSKGIGLATVKLLAKEHNVYVLSRTVEDLENLAVTYIKFDATQNQVSELTLPEIIDGFVYFPGSINLRPFHMIKSGVFRNDMDINFFSLMEILQHILPNLKRSKQASLVFLSTVAVKLGMPFHTSIAAAKGAVEGFAKALAAELAPGIRVNVIAPSLINTTLAGKLLSSEEKKMKMGEKHPLKRVGEAGDIANMVEFLLSEKSNWMTGQILAIDGGLSTINSN